MADHTLRAYKWLGSLFPRFLLPTEHNKPPNQSKGTRETMPSHMHPNRWAPSRRHKQQRRGKVSVPKRERYQYQNGEGIITKAGPPELPNRKRLYYQKLRVEHLSTEMIRNKVLVSLPKSQLFVYKQQK